MLTLLLLRHAKAEPATPGAKDKDRPLALRGRADAAKLGAAISAEGLLPDLILCSTARRTMETLECAAPSFDAVIPTREEPAIYEANVARLLSLIRRTAPSTHRLMLIGHNPGFEDLVTDLMRSADKAAKERFEKKYPTSGLAVLTFDVESWSKLAPGSGYLEKFLAPRYLE
jgi:phosphohistidine phosphatase